MVAHFGMSELIGPVFHEHKTEHPFLGQRMAQDGGTSPSTVHAIEEEARKILLTAQKEATDLIFKHREQLEALSDFLMEKESIEGVELANLMGPSVKVRGSGEGDALH